MSALDRDKALSVLLRAGFDTWTAAGVLNSLEECVHPARPFVVHSEEEFRGRIDAEAKLARIAALCDENDPHNRYAPSVVTISALRAVLDGGAA